MASKSGTLRVKIAGDAAPLEKAMGKATGILQGFATGGVAIFAGLGAAAGAVLVSELGDAMEKGRLEDRLGAQLNLTEDEAAKAGKIAGDLYADAYGDSLGQVHDAVGAVMSSLGDLDDGEVEDLTAKALDLAAAFDVDVNEAVNAAGVVLRQGLARDGEEAFDLITRAMQEVPQAMRSELLPILEEYGQDFAALGITGPDAFGLLVEAAQDGRFELDKTGDAVKELTVRVSNMDTSAVEAFDAMGLNAEEMADKIATGGETARGAFDTIIQGLLDIESPSARAQAAVGLFGEPINDLSVTEIPAFLTRMAEMDTSLGDVEGAATRMGNQLNDNVATKIESFKRKAGAYISDWAYKNVIPAAEEVMAAFEKDGVGGAFDKALELWGESLPEIQAWFDGSFKPWWEDVAVPWMKYIGGEMGAGLVNAMVEALVDGTMNSLSEGGPIGGLINSVNRWIGDRIGIEAPEVRIPVPDFEVPNFGNPIPRPTTPGTPSAGQTFGGPVAFHTGGLVTSSLPRMPGDRPDERTIRAQVGERVSTRGQQRPIEVKQYFTGPVTEQLTGRAAAFGLRMAG